ncbi:sialidase family protein [Streptomyces sp. 4N509B]|uniref:sialidase family protein n=1 Tax=Streptomyces sp. 4N509B TaxID=3457413 RepID=UPI003FD5F048
MRLTTAGIALAAVLVPINLSAATPAASASPAVRYSTVFQQGQDGYHTFRVPAVVQAADGTLLAFAEGRVRGSSDNGNIDLVMKRSRDGGASWGPLEVVIDDGANKFGNPVPVLDRWTGQIVLNVTRTGGEVDGDDIRCGLADTTQTRRSFVLFSEDHGESWTDPVEITADVRPDNWRHFVGGPGHAIQLTRGEHAGRLVIPGNHSVAPPEGSGIDCLDNRLYGAHSLYSDDHGLTWHLGGVDTPLAGTINPNESIAAELSDGRVYFNARDQHGTSAGSRAATTSSDGGATFDQPYQEVPDLVSPVVQGSVVSLTVGGRPGGFLVFSAPGQADARRDLTLSFSLDDARTWHSGLVIHEGPAGYSDLVQIRPGSDGHGRGVGIGVLYENGVPTAEDPTPPYFERITFARLPAGTLDSTLAP